METAKNKPSRSQAQKAADKRYRDSLRKKFIAFNEKESDLWDYVQTIDNFTQ